MTYAIVDIETTGGRAERDRIIEIGVALHDGTKVIRKFESLINPEQPVPAYITQLTGIHTDMVRNAPKFYEIAKQIVEITQGAVFVAHNVRFDYGFIQEEFNRLGYKFQRKQLCTCRLSRQLFPQLPRHNLDTLISHLGIVVPPDQRHRAMGDVLATVELFDTLMQLDSNGDTFDKQLNQGIKESTLPPGITMDKLHSLPETCGVYYFHNDQGVVNYVGKSINIRKRVMQHFADKSEKEQRIRLSIRDITFQETGGELMALVLESLEIKQLRPLYNHAQRQRRQLYGVFSYENGQGFRCLFADANVNHKTPPLAKFDRLFDAKNALMNASGRFELCHKYTHLDSRTGPCLQHKLGKCLGACAGAEHPETYNPRVAQALQFMTSSFVEDMVIFDNGRNEDEQGYILIENGVFQGYGFLDKQESASLHTLRESITLGEHHPDLALVINQYMRKNPKLKVVKI